MRDDMNDSSVADGEREAQWMAKMATMGNRQQLVSFIQIVRFVGCGEFLTVLSSGVML